MKTYSSKKQKITLYDRYNYFCVCTQKFLLAHAKIKALCHQENQATIE